MLAYRLRVVAAIVLIMVAAWALVSRAVEVGPPWVPTVLAILGAVWMASLALTSLWFLLKTRRPATDESE